MIFFHRIDFEKYLLYNDTIKQLIFQGVDIINKNFTVDRIITDKIGGDIAVLLTDDEKSIEINISMLPFEIKEGDILTGQIDGELVKNESEKEIRTERINNLFEKLKNRGKN